MGPKATAQFWSLRSTRQIQIFPHLTSRSAQVPCSPQPRWHTAERLGSTCGHTGRVCIVSSESFFAHFRCHRVLIWDFKVAMPLFCWGSQLLPSLQWLEAVLPACFRACLNSRVFIRTQRAFRCFWTVDYLAQWLTKYMVLHNLLLENIYKSVSCVVWPPSLIKHRKVGAK